MTRSPLVSLAFSALIFAGASLGGGGAQAKQLPIAPCVYNGTCGKVTVNPNHLKLIQGYGKKKPVFGYGGYGHHHGWGYGAAALAGGMALGAIAASAASSSAEAGDCYFERRKALDEDGNVYVRRVRVCE